MLEKCVPDVVSAARGIQRNDSLTQKVNKRGSCFDFVVVGERERETVSCVAMVTTVQWTRVVSRCATNRERWMLLLCGLVGCGWLKSCQLQDEVKKNPFFFSLTLF